MCLSWTSDESAATAVAAEIGGRAVRADVTDESAVGALFDAAADRGPVTAVVANAGIVAPKTSIAEMSVDRMRRMLEVNALGAMITIREALRRLPTDRGGSGGSVVGVGSVASTLGSAGT